MKVLIAILYESGARIGEILSLKIQNVSFNQYGARLIVKGKTGQRVIPIIWFANLLREFIESHPFKNNPENSLWVCIGPKNKNQILDYVNIKGIIRRWAKRAGIKKRVNPHIFRHSRATYLAKYLTEAQMKEYFGWMQSSKMASIYVHLSGRDVDESLLKAYGIETNGEDKLKVELVTCPKCGEKNPIDAVFCLKCGYPLKENLIVQEKRNEKIVELVVKFLQILAEENPRIKKKFYELVKKENALELFK